MKNEFYYYSFERKNCFCTKEVAVFKKVEIFQVWNFHDRKVLLRVSFIRSSYIIVTITSILLVIHLPDNRLFKIRKVSRFTLFFSFWKVWLLSMQLGMVVRQAIARAEREMHFKWKDEWRTRCHLLSVVMTKQNKYWTSAVVVFHYEYNVKTNEVKYLESMQIFSSKEMTYSTIIHEKYLLLEIDEQLQQNIEQE